MNSSPTLPKVGDLAAGRYRIIREIGRGGFGVVFLARQEAIERDVAIKFLLPEVASNPTEVERFRREVFHASGLTNPHTITLYDYGRSPAGLFYVVMEYLQGMNLRDWLEINGPLSIAHTRQLLEQILQSLEEAHNRELIHRDLKPENIFITNLEEGALHAKVLDFGLSKFVGDPNSTLYRGPSLTAEGQICGTPQYMSPEHAYGEKVEPPGDIYSLGLLIYEALLGYPAFNGATPLDILLLQVKEPTPPLPAEFADTPVAKFIAKATQKEADQRFANAGQALRWLYQHPEPQSARITSAENFFAPQPPPPVQPAPSPEENTAQGPFPLAPPKSTSEALEPAQAPTIASRKGALESFELRVTQAPLFGRRYSMARIDAWLASAQQSGGLLLLTGDAGVGKSAVLRAWQERLANYPDLRVLSGSYPRGTAPLTGLKQALEPLLISSPNEPSGLLNPTQSRFLKGLLEPATPNFSPEEGTTNDIAHHLFDMLLHVAHQTPLLLILEDLQNADPVTLRLLELLLDNLYDGPLPIAIALSARSADAFPIHRRQETESILHWPLNPLSDADLAELLDHLFKSSEGLKAGILRLAAGNPALLLHVSRYLLDSDLLIYRPDRNHWDLSDPSTPIEELVPLDLQELIIKRANRHLQRSKNEPALRAILHRAVLIGDQFPAHLLENCLRGEGQPQLASQAEDLLEELVRAGLLQRHDTIQSRSYIFARPLHRASLIRMVESIDDWRHFHELVAHELIALDAADHSVEAREAAIADHFSRAGDHKQAFAWWMRAARQAESEHRAARALEYLRRAETFIQGHRQIEPQLATSLRLQQGRLFAEVSEFGPAEDALRQAADHARQDGDSSLHAQSLELLARVVLLQGALNEAERLLQQTADLYEVLDNFEGQSRVRLGQADLAAFRGQYAKARQLFEILRLEITNSPEYTDRSIEIGCLIGLARCDYAAGNLPRAWETIQNALELAEEIGDDRARAEALIEATHIAVSRTGLEEAEALAHQALRLARQQNDALLQGNAHLALGITLRRSTNLDRARVHALRAREFHESTGYIYGLLKDILLRAEIYWLQGEPERALFLAEDTARLHTDLGDRHGWTLSALYQAVFLLELERPNKAQEILEKLLIEGDRHSLGLYEPQCLFYLGMTLEAQGSPSGARAAYEEALTLAQTMELQEFVSLSAISLAKLSLLQGNFEVARERATLAIELAAQLGHSYANIFALLGNALLAKLDNQDQIFFDLMDRLRPYLGSPNAPNMHVHAHLQSLKRLMQSTSTSPHHQTVTDALDEMLHLLPSLFEIQNHA